MKLYVVMPVINCLDLTQGAVDSLLASIPFTVIVIDNGSVDGTQRWGNMLDGQDIMNKRTFKYVRNPTGKSVAASWNQGIKIAFEDPQCEYVAVLNNDVVLHPKTLDHLMAFMDKTKYLMTTGDNIKDRMSIEVMQQMELPVNYSDHDLQPINDWRAEGPDFSCFLINRETIRVIGWFDENYIGAYCEDQDYHARCQRCRDHVIAHNDQGISASQVHFKRLSTAPYFHYASQTLAKNVALRSDIANNHGHNHNYYLQKWGGEHNDVMDGKGFVTPFGDATKNWRSI